MLSPYERDRQASIKDFKYRFKKNPCEYFKVGTLFTACLVASWYVHPVLPFGISGLMGGLIYLDLYGGATRVIHRRDDHTLSASAYITCENFSAFTTHISTNHYEENDYEALAQQNTLYLCEVLRTYAQCSPSEMRRYEHAAEILLAHHANTQSVLQWLPATHKGRQWLEMQQTTHKAKIP